MMSQLDELKKQSYIDLDTIFRPSTDKDYDLLSGGVTRQSFCKNYQEWLVCCNNRREPGEVLSSYFLQITMIKTGVPQNLQNRNYLHKNTFLTLFLHKNTFTHNVEKMAKHTLKSCGVRTAICLKHVTRNCKFSQSLVPCSLQAVEPSLQKGKKNICMSFFVLFPAV